MPPKLTVTQKGDKAIKKFITAAVKTAKQNTVAYVLTKDTSGTVKIGPRAIPENRTAEQNLKIYRDLSPERNPVFLKTNERKAILTKLRRAIDAQLKKAKYSSGITDYRFMKLVGEQMVYYIQKHIKKGEMKQGPVKALKSNYARLKRYNYGDVPVLVRTGQLIRSFVGDVKKS
jgi:hypothetical protein